jgi:hypothetical protein
MRVWQRRRNSVEMFFASSKCAIEDLAKPKYAKRFEVLASAPTSNFEIEQE